MLYFKCLKCNGDLGHYQYNLAKYQCQKCHQVYHATDGIVDFLIDSDDLADNIHEDRLSSFAGQVLDIDIIAYSQRLGSLFHDYTLKSNQPLSSGALVTRPASALLDVGCGYGALLLAAATRFDLVVGVNIDLQELQSCRRLIKDKNVSNVILVRASAHNLPFRPAQFSAITCIDVMEHVRNPTRVLNQLKIMLKPQSRLYLGIPNRFSLRPDLHTGLRWIGFMPVRWGNKYTAFRGKYPQYQGLNWFSLKDVETLLKSEFGSQYVFVRSGVHKSWLARLAQRVWEVPVLSILARRLVSEFEIIAWA